MSGGEFKGTWVGSYGPWGYQTPPLAGGQYIPFAVGAVLRLQLGNNNAVIGKSTFTTGDISSTLDLTGQWSEEYNSTLGIFEAKVTFADNNGSSYEFYFVRVRKDLLAFHSASGYLTTQGLMKLSGYHGSSGGPANPQLSKMLEGTWVAAYGPVGQFPPLPTGQKIPAPVAVVACWAFRANGSVEGKVRVANGTDQVTELPVSGTYQTPATSTLGLVEAEMSINIGPNALRFYLAREADDEFSFVQTNTPRPIIYGKMLRVVN